MASLRAAAPTRPPSIVARLAGELVEVRGGVAYTSEGRGVRAYDAHCRRWCSPLWIAPGWLGLQTVARRTAYVGRAGRIDAYSTRCRADGGRCAPAFRIPQLDPVLRQTDYATELRLDSPVVGANETYVAAGETAGSSHPADGQGRVFAFPLTCDVTCRSDMEDTAVRRNVGRAASRTAGLRGQQRRSSGVRQGLSERWSHLPPHLERTDRRGHLERGRPARDRERPRPRERRA